MNHKEIMNSTDYELTSIQLKLAELSYIFSRLKAKDGVDIDQNKISAGIALIVGELGKTVHTGGLIRNS